MKPRKFLINPASAIALAAFLALPMSSLAQFDSSPIAGPAAKPVCVYKGVMSDAEIELCTGHPVHYNYGVDSGRVATRESTGVAVKQATSSGRTYRSRGQRPSYSRL
jgi:hypothetical protein